MDRALEDGDSDTPLEFKSMQTLVTDRLRTAIVNGQFAPGARLRQDDLAARLNVGRMPIREALLILQSEGLIEHRPHRGAVVVSLRPDDIREIFGIRSLLEGRAASLAAPLLTASDLERLRQTYAGMTHVDHDVERWLALNHEFHTTIYTASGWPRLQAMIDALRNTVQPYLRLTFSLVGRAAQQEHHRILKAAEEHDAQNLERLTIEHLNRTAGELIAYLLSSTASQRSSGRPHGAATTCQGADAIARSTT